MPRTDADRIYNQLTKPHIVLLWRALQPLRTVVSFMNTGAHPDDETSSLLAAIGLRDGVALSFACANRGEGGQNDIGVETTADLGVVRTAEMERAAHALNMRLYWLSEHPDDSITDFGFSKSGVETLDKWQHDRALQRFVEIIRTEKPDILCPTFLDIPGQHGHHRAMTALAPEAIKAAADPAFLSDRQPPWQVHKFYLPAWSGAGDSYDDDLPPPETTLTIDANGREAVTGWSWAQIAQQSRVFHRTQGMGRWVARDTDNQWPMHLVSSTAAGADTSLFSGLAVSLKDLTALEGTQGITQALIEADRECTAAIDAFPNGNTVVLHATRALEAVRQASADCSPEAKIEIQHRLIYKEEQLSHVIRIASDIQVHGCLQSDRVRPGDRVRLETEVSGSGVSVVPELPAGWTYVDEQLQLPASAQITDPYPDTYFPGSARLPALNVTVIAHGVSSSTRVPFEQSPRILPTHSADLSPASLVLNSSGGCRRLRVAIIDRYPSTGSPVLDLPEHWMADSTADGFSITVPEKVDEDLFRLPLTIDGQRAFSIREFVYPHIAPRIRVFPAGVQVRVLKVAIPEVDIAYVGGGNDRVDYWLKSLGFKVTALHDAQLNASILAKYKTLVVGIFAFRTRPALSEMLPDLHAWIRSGGNLVTLYHRPWDAWVPNETPPLPLTIVKPSLRWRVTDENSEVTHLLPDHTLLNNPNTIDPQDWSGWHKERGLYFAREWHSDYQALLSMADPDETPQRGALLSARIGAGRHTHTSLILHHQMEKLTPGAFRLMANLVAPVS